MGKGSPGGWLALAPFLLLFLGISISPRTPIFNHIFHSQEPSLQDKAAPHLCLTTPSHPE